MFKKINLVKLNNKLLGVEKEMNIKKILVLLIFTVAIVGIIAPINAT